MSVELTCPHCDATIELPEDCEHGGRFTTPCNHQVEALYSHTTTHELWALVPDESVSHQNLVLGGTT